VTTSPAVPLGRESTPARDEVTIARYRESSQSSSRAILKPIVPAATTHAPKSSAVASLRSQDESYTGLYRRAVDEDPQQRQLNIHLDPENLAGVYSNFANISFSDYEFTLTFARIDHEVEEGDVPGVVVARVNMSTKFMQELLEAMNDAYSKWTSREGIRNLPETPDGEDN
jgi:Protein of unknown function (DUF3467)